MISVTIIIPVYNGEEYLEQCIQSVLNQTLKTIEVIFVDDGSVDNSAQIIRKFADKDKRISLFQQKNQGPGPAKNFALKYAKGKFVAFLDADDYYLDAYALEKMVKTCEERNVFVCASLRKTLIKGIEVEEKLFQETDKDNVLDYIDYQLDYDYQNYLFHREFLLKNKCCFPGYRRYEDPVFLTKTLFKAQKFTVADTYLYCYRLPFMDTRFTPEKTCDLLKGIEDNLIFSEEQNLKILFENTVYRLEYEYINIILKNISENNLDILYLLLHINQIICRYIGKTDYVIRPLRVILVCLNGYERKLLERIKGKRKIALYGAGFFGQKFYSYLKKHNLSEKVEKFIVSRIDGNSPFIEKIPVVTLDAISKKDIYILVAIGEKYQKEIEMYLCQNGVENFEMLNDIFLNMIADLIYN